MSPEGARPPLSMPGKLGVAIPARCGSACLSPRLPKNYCIGGQRSTRWNGVCSGTVVGAGCGWTCACHRGVGVGRSQGSGAGVAVVFDPYDPGYPCRGCAGPSPCPCAEMGEGISPHPVPLPKWERGFFPPPFLNQSNTEQSPGRASL